MGHQHLNTGWPLISKKANVREVGWLSKNKEVYAL